MNWANALYDLYDKNENLAGIFQAWGENEEKKKQLMLLPLSHTTVLAQIEVSISSEGEFLRARSLAKEEATTLIPVSEESAIRTSGPVPHPLMDSLQYVAGDYDAFVRAESNKKGNPVTFRERYNNYIKMLKDWCSSDYAHPKAASVFAYLKKARLMEDLIREKVLLVDEDGLLSANKKINNILQEKAFVRFRVESGEAPELTDSTGRFKPEIWEDTTLQKSYCDYFLSQSSDTDLCYLTGKIGRKTESYPKKIRNEGDGTKLLSSNDKRGYTFRGRFSTSAEAFSIGYDASQKIHSALKWIIRRQGYQRDGLCVVTWESDLKPYVSIFDDAADIVIHAEDDFNDDAFTDTVQSSQNDTNQLTAAQFNRALDGYSQSVDNTSNMVVMALDDATPGRLAITYYNRMLSACYMENIGFWHESCRWRHAKFIHKRLFFYEGMASLNDIALALYGTEQNNLLTLSDSNGKAPMLASTFQRLVPCMLERKRIPRDMARLAVLRASAPLAFEKNNWRKILSIACSIVKKTKYDWKGEEWDMVLQHNCTYRSYLYGRLLAIADLVEEATFDAEEKRETNAMRYMNAFSRRPFRTWQIIEEKLPPYLSKLSKGQRVYYKKMLNEIHSLFTPDIFADDSALDGLYLLGYHSQVNEHYSKKKDSNENEQDNEQGGYGE